MDDFDKFLDGAPAEVEEQEPETPEAEAPAPDPTPETKPEPTGEEQAAPPAAEEPKQQQPSEDWEAKARAFMARAEDERRKRQQLEEQLKQAKPEEKPDFWADPDAAIGQLEQKFEQRLQAERATLSESMVRAQFADYDQKLDVFAEMVQANPALSYQLAQSPNPALFAYKTAEKELKLRELGDPDEYRAKLEAEVRAKVEAELKEKLAAEATKAAAIPESLASARGGGAKSPEWAGPPSLDDILN